MAHFVRLIYSNFYLHPIKSEKYTSFLSATQSYISYSSQVLPIASMLSRFCRQSLLAEVYFTPSFRLGEVRRYIHRLTGQRPRSCEPVISNSIFSIFQEHTIFIRQGKAISDHVQNPETNIKASSVLHCHKTELLQPLSIQSLN